MFTGMIQNLLNSSSETAAIKRAQQLNNYVQSQQRISNGAEGVELNTFEDVLNSSLNVHTRFNVNKPTSNVKFGLLSSKNVEAKPVFGNVIDSQSVNENKDIESRVGI